MELKGKNMDTGFSLLKMEDEISLQVHASDPDTTWHNQTSLLLPCFVLLSLVSDIQVLLNVDKQLKVTQAKVHWKTTKNLFYQPLMK